MNNVEHVIDGATVLSDLIDETTHLRVLATSRERLRLNGEQVYEVEPLGLQPDGAAVQPFIDRARLVRPDIDPTSEQRDTIVDICTRLDGVPTGHRAGCCAVPAAAADRDSPAPAPAAAHAGQRITAWVDDASERMLRSQPDL